MKTQILIPWKPYKNFLVDAANDDPVSIIQGPYGPIQTPYGQEFARGYDSEENPNYSNTKSFLQNVRSGETLALDLYEGVDIPLNYTILDIRQPEKRKTNFSKTIVLPGTKNNNRIFNHIYEIGADSTFNPIGEKIVSYGAISVPLIYLSKNASKFSSKKVSSSFLNSLSENPRLNFL
jgi:hypothetical protein